WISYAKRRRPQMSTLSTVPFSAGTTLIRLFTVSASVRSSRSLSRMSMSSYLRICHPPPLVFAAMVGPWQEGICIARSASVLVTNWEQTSLVSSSGACDVMFNPGALPTPRRVRRHRNTADPSPVEVLTGHDHDEDEGEQSQQGEEGDE